MTTAIRLTEHDFLNKLRKAEEGQVYSGLEDGVDDIWLLVLKPVEYTGIYLAPSAMTFKSGEAFTRFVREIESLTETPPPLSDSRNRIIRRPKDTKRVSASQFINRLKHAEDGEIKLGHVDGNFEITQIVTKPAKASGTFMAPRIDAFDYDFGWYSQFIGKIVELLMTPPEERKTFNIRMQLPWIEGLDEWGNGGNNDGPDQG
jgi:hypothetical protein